MLITDPLIRSIAELPAGSRAPHVVCAILSDTELSVEARLKLADLFMMLYRRYTHGGKLRVPRLPAGDA